MKKTTILFTPEQVTGIKLRLSLIEQKALELDVLRDGLAQYIQNQTGADLARQTWALDLDHALLEREQ